MNPPPVRGPQSPAIEPATGRDRRTVRTSRASAALRRRAAPIGGGCAAHPARRSSLTASRHP